MARKQRMTAPSTAAAPAQAVRIDMETHTRLGVYVATNRGPDGKKLLMMDVVKAALDEYLKKRGA